MDLSSLEPEIRKIPWKLPMSKNYFLKNGFEIRGRTTLILGREIERVAMNDLIATNACDTFKINRHLLSNFSQSFTSSILQDTDHLGFE